MLPHMLPYIAENFIDAPAFQDVLVDVVVADPWMTAASSQHVYGKPATAGHCSVDKRILSAAYSSM
jgi:hypothetical protein